MCSTDYTSGAFPHLVGSVWNSSSSCKTPTGATAESGLVAPLGYLYFELSGTLCERGGARVHSHTCIQLSFESRLMTPITPTQVVLF